MRENPVVSQFEFSPDRGPAKRYSPAQCLGGCGRMPQPWEGRMTNSEEKVLWRGVAAGMLVGLATGLMIALFIVIATKPELLQR